MEDSKKWWASKTIWAGVYVILRGVYEGIATLLCPELKCSLPEIPGILDTIIGGIVGGVVIKGRVGATKTIG